MMRPSQTKSRWLAGISLVKPFPGFKRELTLREHELFVRRMELILNSCARHFPTPLQVVLVALKRKGSSLLHLERAFPPSLIFCTISMGTYSQLLWRIVCLRMPWADLDAFCTAQVHWSWNCSHCHTMRHIRPFPSGWSSRVPIHSFSTTTSSTCTPWQPISMQGKIHPLTGFSTSSVLSLLAGTQHGKLVECMVYSHSKQELACFEVHKLHVFSMKAWICVYSLQCLLIQITWHCTSIYLFTGTINLMYLACLIWAHFCPKMKLISWSNPFRYERATATRKCLARFSLQTGDNLEARLKLNYHNYSSSRIVVHVPAVPLLVTLPMAPLRTLTLTDWIQRLVYLKKPVSYYGEHLKSTYCKMIVLLHGFRS